MWGKLISVKDSNGNSVSDTHIGVINLIRYRGYYYDNETGFYYLQTRYYDPGIKRFINTDSLASTGQSFLGYNMFAYCGNNPVNRIDPTWEAWWHWALAATIVVVCAAATVVTCGMSLSGAALAIGMVAGESAALSTASTVAAVATIGSGLALLAMATDAAIDSSSAHDFFEQGTIDTVLATGIGGLFGGGYGYLLGRNINNPSLPTDKSRTDHIFRNDTGHLNDSTEN